MHDYLTTAEVAEYLRLKERTIYELVARKEIPCSRATGKLLFPRRQVDLWIEGHVELQDPRLAAPPPIIGGSSDPLLDWAVRESGSGLAGLVEGSSAGLQRLGHGGAVAAGIHLGDEDGPHGGANIVAVRDTAPPFDLVLVHWAWREQGLIVLPHNPLHLRMIADVHAKQARVIPRQGGAGTALLLERLAGKAGIEMAGFNILPRPALTHTDVAVAVMDDVADCGLAVGSVSRRFGLGFVPLHRERFDLACRRRDLLEPPLQKLLAFTRTEEFRDYARHLGHYDVERCGEVLFNR